ncbi:hypothetical protein ACIHCV_04110 [Streptomyces sp. NPDC051956]|uniref:hypothetical protein n=1 Tax=Streptomyces sp. NPDC051956 TaxID=3365677 RepID=UPI0037D5E10B
MNSKGQGLRRRRRAALLMSGYGLLVAGLSKLFESGADWNVLWSALLGATTSAAIGFLFPAALTPPRAAKRPLPPPPPHPPLPPPHVPNAQQRATTPHQE